MIKKYEDLCDVHIDVLREIGNIGAGNAATALSKMLNDKVRMSLPIVRITCFNDAVNALGGPETMTVGVLVKFCGEADGMIMFLLDMEDAKGIMSILIDNFDCNEDELTELKLSAIKEIGNILGTSYINSISTLTGLRINVTVPQVAIDMAGAIMSVPIIEFGAVGDKVMFIEEDFYGEQNKISSNIIMFAQIDTLKVIMEKLGIEI
jgi:chemotaxis protein CheC